MRVRIRVRVRVCVMFGWGEGTDRVGPSELASSGTRHDVIQRQFTDRVCQDRGVSRGCEVEIHREGVS